jgi:hypothetical protein
VTRRPTAVGAIVGFVGTAVLISADAAPVVEDARRLLPGAVGFVLVGAVAGWLANDRRAWPWLVAGALAASVAYLLLRVAFASVTAPSLVPVDSWRLWLFGSLVLAVVLVSVGFAIGRLLRGWRPQVGWGPEARTAVVVAVASVVASGAIAFGFAGTRLVIPADARILTVRVSDAAIELSTPSVESGMYHVIYESTASRARLVSLVAANAASFDVEGLSPAEADAWFEGKWLTEAPDPPPRYSVTAGTEVAPGERQYGGELRFGSGLPGSRLIWYTSDPGAIVVSSRGEEIAWPPGQRAILTIR